MNKRNQNLYLVFSLTCITAGMPIIALATDLAGIIGGCAIVCLAAICFYGYGEEKGKHDGIYEAITWAKKYHGFDFIEAKRQFRDWGI